MATITKPMALDESFNTTESTPRNQADVLVGIETAIRQGFGQVASAVEYDNTNSGLTADNVQDAIDEVDDTVDVIANDVAEISSDIESTQTVSGNPITLTDAAPINAESLVVELEPKQDLHGQDAPYVGGAGKNKLPMTVDGLKAINTAGTWSGNVYTREGCTFEVLTDSDNNVVGIKVNAPSSHNTATFSFGDFTRISGTTYILNGCPANGSTSSYKLRWNDVGYDYGNGKTTDGTAGTGTVAIDIMSNTAVTNLIFYPMIRLSTETDPTFAPYSNICPITGYTECDVDDVGFNQWDEEWELGAISATGKASASDRIRSKNLISCLPNTTYYWKLGNNGQRYGDLVFYDENQTVIPNSLQSDKGNKTFTTPANAHYFLFCAMGAYGTTYNHDICINISKPTGTPKNGDYVPYQSSNATIQFGQTVYGGKVNVTDGGTDDEYINLIDFSNITFNGNQRGNNAYEIYFDTADKKNGADNLLANIMPVKTTFTDVAEFSIRGFINGSEIAIKFPISVASTPEQCKQWCIDNNLQIVYEKATPTTISTPPSPLKLLKGTNHITTNGTTINLGYQPDNVIGEVKEKVDKTNYSEIVKYTISGNTAETIPLVIDGTAHNNIPIVTDITKYRMLCVELVLTPRTEITGVYFSAITFTDGIYLPSGIYVPVYMPSGNFHADVTINPDGNGGFKLSYIAINQSQSTPPDYYSIRVRAFNQY